jgi:type VI protein secretion system component VasF
MPAESTEAPAARRHDLAATPPWVLVAFALLIAAVAFVLRT